jgi:hypothetical protein
MAISTGWFVSAVGFGMTATILYFHLFGSNSYHTCSPASYEPSLAIPQRSCGEQLHHKSLKVAIDRTQWRDKNVFVISLIWDKRGIPLYGQLLNKRGSSNIAQQQALISPVKELLKDYEIIILGDREFWSVKLASWLCEKQVKFVLRIKQERYIQS